MDRIRRLSMMLVAGTMLGSIVTLRAQDHTPTAVDPRAEALRSALTANLDYCRDWLDGNDYKTLARTAGGVVILADMFARCGDVPAWQEATGRLTEAARSLEAAAKQADANDGHNLQSCRDLLARAQGEFKSLAALQPAGKPQKTAGSRPPLRTLMYLQEGILSDAKTALAAGDAKNAKMNAEVLSELGQAVLNDRSDAMDVSRTGLCDGDAGASRLAERRP